MRSTLDRVLRLVDSPVSPSEAAWLVSPQGLAAACGEIVALGDTETTTSKLLDDRFWRAIVDASPYPLGIRLEQRGRAIIAAVRLADNAARNGSHDDDALRSLSVTLGSDRPGNAQIAHELVDWVRGFRPAPTRTARVSFLVDEHASGRVLRLTLARIPGAEGVAIDIGACPFTFPDDDFVSALEHARSAVDDSLDGIRWSVCGQSGDVPLEVVGGSVGLAALACFERMSGELSYVAESRWVFTGQVDDTGEVRSCVSGGAGPRALANKLRAAGHRNVVVATEDLQAATTVAELNGLGIQLYGVGNRGALRSLLSARLPHWHPGEGFVIVDREDEIATLQAIADRDIHGQPALVSVVGEPGIGKTTLARAFLGDRLKQDWLVAWASCSQAEATVGYRAAGAVLRGLVAAVDDPAAIVGRDTLATLSAVIPELDDRAAQVSVIDDARRLAIFDAAAHVVRQISGGRPLAIVIDDAHWADRPSLLLVGHLLRHCQDVPITTLIAYRDAEVADAHPLSSWLSQMSSVCRIDSVRPKRLSSSATSALLGALHGQGAPEEFVSAMHLATGGNPLFISELSRHATTMGSLDPRRGSWRLGLDSGDPLPARLRDVLGERTAALAPAARDVCRILAASSSGVTFEVLGRALDLGELVLLDALDNAIGAGVVTEHDSGEIGVVYELRHPLFRQVVMDRVSTARRAVYHFALAKALPSMPDATNRWIAELSYQLHLAGPTGDPERAADVCSRAGDLAMAKTAYDDAVTHYRRATAAAGWLGTAGDSMIADLELRTAVGLHRAGDRDGRQQAAVRAFKRAEALDSPTVMARAALVHGGARSTYGLPSVPTMQMLTTSLGRLDPTDASHLPLRAQVMSRLAQETYHVQQFDDAKQLGVDAMELLVYIESPAVRAAVLDGRAWTLHTPDDLHERLSLATEMVRQAMSCNDVEWEMMGRSWRCTALLELGDIVAIDHELARLNALTELAPVPSHLFRIATMRCTRAMLAGQYDLGTKLASQAHDIGALIEPENATQTMCAQLLGMFREQGLLPGLVDMAEQMVADFPMVPGWKAALAFVNLEADRVDRARTLFGDLAIGGFSGIPRDLAWIQALAYLAEVACALGDAGGATTLATMLAPFAGRNVGLFDIASSGAVDYYLGLLAATSGHRTAAVRSLRRAVVFNDSSGQQPAAARARSALAWLLTQGSAVDVAEAEGLRERALDDATRLGLGQLQAQLTDTSIPVGLCP